jgi:hypothetical protein
MKSETYALLLVLPLVVVACATNKAKTDSKSAVIGEEEDAPSLTKPKIRSFIVPDTIEGNKYIKSHRVYILEDPGVWSK